MIVNKSTVFKAILLGCVFSLMLIPVSLLVFLLPTNGVEPIVYYKRLIFGLGLNFLFSFFIPFVLIIFPAIFRKLLFFVLAFCSVVFVTVSVFHFKTYQQQLSAQSLTILMDTNFKEATEYAGFYSSAPTIALVLVTLVVMLTIAVWAWRLLNQSVLAGFNKVFATGALLTLLCLGYIGWNKIYFVLSNPIPFFIQMAQEVSATHFNDEKMTSSQTKASGAKLIAQAKNPMTHIIIIGESATPSHMSLYGYQRDTNPLLKRPISGMQFYMGQDSCSSQPSTHLSIAAIMLGGKAKKIDAQGFSPPNMLSTIQDAGYKIDWISNQQQAGYGSLRSFWSSALDHSQFLNKTDYRIGYDFDEILLPSLESALKNNTQPKVVILHMMGSHPGYMMRYPKTFEHWNGSAQVPNSVRRKNEPDFDAAIFNAYDNSLLYSDYVISEILKIAQKHGVASVVYFSDHGQNLGEKSSYIGHSTENGPRQGFEVPLLFWLNTAKLAQLNLDVATFQANLKKSFSLERIEYTLFDLYGIHLPDSNLDKSLLSGNYQVTKRHCDEIKN